LRPDLFAFLLIGSKTDFELLITYVPFIVVAFLAIVVVRILSVYPIIGINKLMGEKISHSWTRVIALAGLRGVVLCVGLLVRASIFEPSWERSVFVVVAHHMTHAHKNSDLGRTDYDAMVCTVSRIVNPIGPEQASHRYS